MPVCDAADATGPCSVWDGALRGACQCAKLCYLHIAPFEHVHNHMHTQSHAGAHHEVLQYMYTDMSLPVVVYHLHTHSRSTTTK